MCGCRGGDASGGVEWGGESGARGGGEKKGKKSWLRLRRTRGTQCPSRCKRAPPRRAVPRRFACHTMRRRRSCRMAPRHHVMRCAAPSVARDSRDSRDSPPPPVAAPGAPAHRVPSIYNAFRFVALTDGGGRPHTHKATWRPSLAEMTPTPTTPVRAARRTRPACWS